MLDLDIGMNERLCAPFHWDDARRLDRGKVLSHDDLEAGKAFGRYVDVDGDGIAWRTLPGTHPTKGSYFTRGTTKDRMARYSEAGPDYVENMQRLQRKFDTAKALVPAPVITRAPAPTRVGVLYYGSTSPAMNEALEAFQAQGVHVDAIRVRAFPFPPSVEQFIAEHDRVFVVEQNRDSQLRSLLVNELEIDPKRLPPIVHYDGTPITARFIVSAITSRLAAAATSLPLHEARQ